MQIWVAGGGLLRQRNAPGTHACDATVRAITMVGGPVTISSKNGSSPAIFPLGKPASHTPLAKRQPRSTLLPHLQFDDGLPLLT